jgi:acetylornithine deacetylase/succinyl-diaminopimelate desuccinylase-like protein
MRIRLGAALGTLLAGAGPARAQLQAVDVSPELAIVRRAMATPQLTGALAYVESMQKEPGDLVEEWIGLCEAYGPSGDEIYRARHIKTMFQIYGLENVHIDAAGNVVGIRPGVGGRPAAILTAHQDVVALWDKDQPIHAYVADGRMWCPGAGDDLIGVIQMLGAIRAMNAANLVTQGDIWFVAFTGEETTLRGGQQFARGNYPHNLDYRRGDAAIELHGQGGSGVQTGSQPMIVHGQLYVFTPFERQIPGEPGADRRWRPSAVDAMARMITRFRAEVSDKRPDCQRCDNMSEAADFYMNMAMVEGMPIRNAPGSEASMHFDLRGPTTARMQQAHAQIQRIAREVCAEFEGCRFTYEVNEMLGRESELPGFDKVNNAGARYAAAAGQALYGGTPTIDPTRGCGDCQGMFMQGAPLMSFRGRVIDYGGGRFEHTARYDQYGGLESPVRRRTSGHHTTQSEAVVSLWAPMKHALVWATSYAGIAPAGSTPPVTAPARAAPPRPATGTGG